MVATAVVVSAVAAVVSAPSVEVASSVVDASPVASLGAGDPVETSSDGSAAESAAESSEPHEAIHNEQHTNPVTATRDRDGPTPGAAAIVRIRSHLPRGIGVDGVIPATRLRRSSRVPASRRFRGSYARARSLSRRQSAMAP
jgi:hypothetical protein